MNEGTDQRGYVEDDEAQRDRATEVVRPSLGVMGERIFDETPPPPPPSFARKCFSDLYDNLGGLILLNAITAVLCLPFVSVMWVMVNLINKGGLILLPLALLTSLLASGAYGALSSFTGQVVEGEPRYLIDYWNRGRRVFWRSWVGFLLQIAITAVIVINIYFYTRQPSMGFKLLGALLLSVLLVWILASLYIWPMIVRGYRWRSILRNAFVLALAAPIRSIIILIILVVLSAVLIGIGIGIFALLFALWATFQNELFVYLRDKFGGEQPAAPPVARPS
jgi:uncharacterized membrane protein YesL